MKEREALKLALEALDWEDCNDDDGLDAAKHKAITAIKEALAQPEQEPVAYIHRNEYNEYRLEPHDNLDIKSIPLNVDVLLFKTPQRTWVEMTDDEAFELIEQDYRMEEYADAALNLIRIAEAKLKEKNTK